MQQVNDILGWMLLGGLCVTLVYMLALVVMHFAMPKALVERYWKSEHFSDFYIGAFTGTLSAPMRTAMLLAAIAVPSIAKKRMMPDVLSFTPAWCRRTAKTFVVVWCVSIASIFIPTFVFMFSSVWENHLAASAGTRDRDWKMLLAMIGVVVCWGGLAVRAAINHLRSRRPKARTTRRSRLTRSVTRRAR